MSNQQQTGDPAGNVLSGVVMAFIIILGAGIVLGPVVRHAWLYYVRAEGYLTMHAATSDKAERDAAYLLEWVKDKTGKSITFSRMSRINHDVIGKGYHNHIIAGLLLLFAYLIFRKWNHPYRGVPSLEGLLKTEHRVWPSLEFVRRFNPLKKWPDELRGIGRYSVSPAVFAIENKILITPKKNSSKRNRIFIEDTARQVYTESLDASFTSYIDLPPFYKVFTCLLAAKEFEFKGYDDVVRYFAKEFAYTNQTVKSIERHINKVCDPLMQLLDGDNKVVGNHPFINELISGLKAEHVKKQAQIEQDIAELGGNFKNIKSTIMLFAENKIRYAFITTYVIGAGRYVRRKGKFPPGRMIFFRPWDRKLFMLLSNTPYYSDFNPYQFVVGFSSESLGCLGHYQHEVYAGRRLDTPYVDTAVAGLKERLIRQNIIEGTKK